MEYRYMVTGYTDLKRSIDELAMIIQAQLQLDPFNKHCSFVTIK